MASGQNKPNGLTVILPKDAIAFVEGLAIEKFHGIGEVTMQFATRNSQFAIVNITE